MISSIPVPPKNLGCVTIFTQEHLPVTPKAGFFYCVDLSIMHMHIIIIMHYALCMSMDLSYLISMQ